MNQPIFITGTDTDAGKTYVTCALLRALAQQGKRCLGLKPIASGCQQQQQQWQSHDANCLMEAANVHAPYSVVNPIQFVLAIAPIIAAQQIGCRLDKQRVLDALQPGLALPADVTLIEGVGGWLQPLNAHDTLADVVISQGWPIILVVGLRLGCINHSLLTAQVLRHTKAQCLGWIGTVCDPQMEALEQNIRLLQQQLDFPCLGILQHGERVAPLFLLDKLATRASKGSNLLYFT